MKDVTILDFTIFIFVLFYLVEHEASIWWLVLFATGLTISAIQDYFRGP